MQNQGEAPPAYAQDPYASAFGTQYSQAPNAVPTFGNAPVAGNNLGLNLFRGMEAKVETDMVAGVVQKNITSVKASIFSVLQLADWLK